jgi:UDP-glucose 4-epimerase
MKILVTGGAGYIGSFMTKRLIDDGYEVIVADSLEHGYKDAVNPKATFEHGDLRDEAFLKLLFGNHQFDAVFHFAAYISMGESMLEPGKYYDDNVGAAVKLLDAMHQHDVHRLIFSSTAGVYGNPTEIPIPEEHRKRPENPYGHSKLLTEEILSWYHKIHRLDFAALRYFNASGAALDGSMGERHDPETHLIPAALAALLQEKSFTLFGTDYDTPDGTCVRDYIHVIDLVDAHILALKKLEEVHGAYTYNVGTGKGYSNNEVLETIKKITGRDITINKAERRPGDAAVLVANADRIKSELHFTPQYSDITTIVESAWKWHSLNKDKAS